MKKILPLFLLFPAFVSYGQIQVNSGMTPQQYVEDVLLGPGVFADNISYIGAPQQIGHLTGGDPNIIGLAGGLLMSSAFATNVVMPGGNQEPTAADGAVNGGQPDLLAIANSVPPLIGQNFSVSSVNHVCVLEFDFIPTGDTVKFKYLFGSDEYLSWVNTTFNDVFAFFLSGPGITGPYQSPPGFPDGAVNIANVPGSNPPLPITISSVNNNLNSQYYNHNPFPHNHIAINGYTDVFEAIYPVQCGQLYHIKLAIADGTDTILESIVMLEEGSFASNAVVNVELVSDVGPPGLNILYEDCGTATLNFHRPPNAILETTEMVILTWGGTAENGIDFTLMPDTIFFEPFQTMVSFTIQAIVDGIPEGVEYVELTLLNVAACNGNGLESFFYFEIWDEPPPLLVEGYEVAICQGDQIEIAPIISGGYGNFHYNWSNIPDDIPSQMVAPLETTEYFITVSDTCYMPSSSDIITVFVPFDGSMIATIDPDELFAPCNPSFQLTSTVTGGNNEYTYAWSTNMGPLPGNQPNITYFTDPTENQTSITLTVTDGCGFQTSTTIPIMYELPGLEVVMPNYFAGLCVDSFTLTPEVTGGDGQYSYTWSVNGQNVAIGSSFTYSAGLTAGITVNVQDGCGQAGSATAQVEIFPFPPVFTPGNDAQATCLDVVYRELIVFDGIPDYTYQWQINGQTVSTTTEFSHQPTQSVNVIVTVTDVCGDSTTEELFIELINTPIEVDLPNEFFASCIDHTSLIPDVSGGDGELSFTWTDPDYLLTTNQSTSYQTYFTTPLEFTVTDECGQVYIHPVVIHIPNDPIVIHATNDTLLCLGQGLVLDAWADGGEGGFTYYWPELELWGPQQFVMPGVDKMYTVIATDICGRTGSEIVNVTVDMVKGSFRYEYLSSYEVQFNSEVSGNTNGIQYYWSFGDGQNSFAQHPFHVYQEINQFIVSLQVTNENECRHISTEVISAPINIYVPNAFTPDGDGLNDVFLIVGEGVVNIEFSVFNRWGELVFFSDDMNRGWTGNHQNGEYFIPDGIYVYKLIYEGADGVRYTKHGHINLLR